MDISKETTKSILNTELSRLAQDLITDLHPEDQKIPKFLLTTLPTELPDGDNNSSSQSGIKMMEKAVKKVIPKPRKKKLSPAMQKRESMRRARNKNGILLSSLKKKIYHCNCVDCQVERFNFCAMILLWVSLSVPSSRSTVGNNINDDAS